MQHTLYLYDNLIDVQISDSYHKQRNTVVYTRDIKLYKDVDNELTFQFMNPDQKRIPITGNDLSFVMFDDATDERTVLVELPITITDGIRGRAKVIIPDAYLYDIDTGKYNYAIQVISGEGLNQAAYIDDNYGVRGVIELRVGPRPSFNPSNTLTFDTITHLTDVVGDLTSLHQNAALHTVVLKFAGDPDDDLVIGFTGTLTVQATLDNVTNQLNDGLFFPVAVANMVEQEQAITLNFNGVFSGVRFLVETTSGEITEVQYRY